MLAYPEMLVGPAQEAGIEVPADVNNFVADDFPHFAVYLGVQLGSPLPFPTAHWDNAKVVAAVPADKIRTATLNDLRVAGLAVGYPIP